MHPTPTTGPWTPDALATLRAMYPHRSAAAVAAATGRSIRSVYFKAAALGIGKTPEFFSTAEAGRFSRARRHSLTATQFQPGQVPWNKGTRGVMPKPAPGKGWQPGNMPHTRQPIGTERRDKDGHQERKVSETRVKRADWQPVRNIVWRAHFGEIPPGFFVVCLDRDPDHLAPANLALLDRAQNMRRNSFNACHPELAALYLLKGQINRQLTRINQRKPAP